MANIFADPINSFIGATVSGTSGALSGATWAGSEFGKLGKRIGGTLGEVSGVMLGAGTGAMAGLFLGSVIGALARDGAVNFYLGDLLTTRRDNRQSETLATNLGSAELQGGRSV